MNDDNKAFGAWSAIGTYLLIAFFAFSYAPVGETFSELGTFFTGGVKSIQRSQSLMLLSMIPVLLLVVVVEMPFSIGSAVVTNKILGKTGDNEVLDMLTKLQGTNIFCNLFIIMLLEELLARWLFLGVLGSIFTGPVMFYVLMLAGNSIWALIHLGNFKNENDKHPARVAPQFIGGLFLSYIYVKYGLLASVLTHFAYNSVLFSMHKLQNVGGIDAVIALVNAAYANLSYALMTKPLSDAAIWFDGSGKFKLEGWEFLDYFYLSLFIGSTTTLIFDILLYDRNLDTEKEELGSQLLILTCFGIPVALGIIFGIYYFLGIFTKDVPMRIFTATLLIVFLGKSPTCSAAMRKFWTHLPSVYLQICTTMALGFVGAFAYMAVGLLVAIPQMILHKMDD